MKIRKYILKTLICTIYLCIFSFAGEIEKAKYSLDLSAFISETGYNQKEKIVLIVRGVIKEIDFYHLEDYTLFGDEILVLGDDVSSIKKWASSNPNKELDQAVIRSIVGDRFYRATDFERPNHGIPVVSTGTSKPDAAITDAAKTDNKTLNHHHVDVPSASNESPMVVIGLCVGISIILYFTWKKVTKSAQRQ
jgi:hypothetical protein